MVVDLLRHLRLFVTVAEELHFSRAADRLGMAQPPLSQAVRRLERELGAELFDRSHRRIRLTAAGALLWDEARELLAREDRLRMLARRAGDGGLGTLRAGVPPDTAATVLTALLAACAERAPGLSVDLREVTTGEQVGLLASGGLDVGLVHRPADTTGLLLGPEVAVDLGVVLPRTSPLARRPEVALGELSGHDLVLFPRAHAPDRYDQVLDVCRAAGFVPGRVRHASNSEFLLALVTAGHGVAFDQGPVARKEPRVAWRPLAGRPLAQRLSGAWPAGRTAHPAARTFAELAAEVLAADRAATPNRTGEAGPVGGPPRPWSVVYG
ncbi:LysR substrate-binding domain-containing protein [Streptomyces sp. NBC_01571]|uniref:LysR family transcriptional regulator n=1 Tax=Streptomyces sp. NBC_01571 TaxID=2975883 RepID=UPI00224FA271|nr:LysR substrate-binding domain-containing protein [Streptomyces sp. NBC_01571]MCX4577935.1 LysR substrate-binding domain-containing protein [Streptomyces sp. NBC_01571]